MIQLSVVIITFNEQHNIGRCLNSVKDVADEIVVVDSFSTDRTEEICRHYDVKFIQHRFEGHVQQKNYAISQASFSYILSLDADEALSFELKKSIQRVKEDWNHDGYYFNRLSNYCGRFIRHGAWYPDRKLRLIKVGKAKWGGTNPHDTLIMDRSATILHITGDLLHYTYSTVQEHIQQANYFSDIAAREAFDQGKKASLLKIVINPFWRFFRGYVLRKGFLDGIHGFTIALISSHETFLKYIKCWFLQKGTDKERSEF